VQAALVVDLYFYSIENCVLELFHARYIFH
jgi:hypothetical protein